ncbi:MAG TPA: hypothetical protein VF712_15230 [Thermoleophilaceae bacterium]|jgi:hypothetical protein
MRLAGAVAATCVLGAGVGTAAQAGPPPALNVVPPAVTGVPAQGLTLGHFRGVWTLGGDNVYTQEWVRCNATGGSCVSTGVTSANYLLGAADVGHAMRVIVTATTDSGGGVSTSATSPPTTPVAPVPVP